MTSPSKDKRPARLSINGARSWLVNSIQERLQAKTMAVGRSLELELRGRQPILSIFMIFRCFSRTTGFVASNVTSEIRTHGARGARNLLALKGQSSKIELNLKREKFLSSQQMLDEQNVEAACGS